MSEALEMLNHIDPSQLQYEEWLYAGMALKDAGLSPDQWDAWSRRDPARYREGDCHQKWQSFHGSAQPITVASLAKMAMAQGWKPPREEGRSLGWNEDVCVSGKDLRIIDADWLQDSEIPDPGPSWNPVKDLMSYLSTLFQSDEKVSYNVESWLNEAKGKYLPKGMGAYDRTAGQLIEQLGKCGGNVGRVIGDADPKAGAWIRFNPMNGTGVRDDNVTSHRYALVESDEIPMPKQYAIIRELELPCAAIVHSGGKSIHAIVKIDADTIEEYRKRVDFLWDVCTRNGLILDRQNRNPSRLSRMPGIVRGGNRQYLIGTNVGKSSWKEWHDWVEDLNDDLPDIEELSIDEKEPELAPCLIDGLLREGHKMLLSGPSKAGKSFALMQLCVALAEGGTWLGWPVKQGRVLYVNLELDERSCRHRFWKIYEALRIKRTPGMLDVWNLRGNATSMDRLAPKLIRRALQKRYAAVVIDPIYKVLTGDENSAEQMAKFCNQFDRICKELGAATIYCHHHSKGTQGQKSSRDRSSGSGVFSRDPDAIVDLIELNIDDARRYQIVNSWECHGLSNAFDHVSPNWRDTCPQDNTVVSRDLIAWAEMNGLADAVRQYRPIIREAATLASGWRVETTLREFPTMPPKSIFFRYPIHSDDRYSLLKDAKAEGEEAPWQKNAKPKKSVKERQKEQNEALSEAYKACLSEGPAVTTEDLAETMGVAEKTVRRYLIKHPEMVVSKGLVLRKDSKNETE